VDVISPANSPRPSAQHLTLHHIGQFFPSSTSNWRSISPHRRCTRLTGLQIILRVRKSVRSIIDLDPKHQSQGTYPPSTYTAPYTDHPTVIAAYSRSLRVVFISAIACFLIVNILVLAIKLPHLKRKQSDDEDRDDAE
jgi:hypothetical protein